MSTRKNHPPRVVGRSREFQEYLDRLPFPERIRAEVNEASYLASLAPRLAHVERLYAEQMLGVEDRPAGPTRNVIRVDQTWGA